MSDFWCHWFGYTNCSNPGTPTASVPEIDASSGALAVAVVLSAVFFVLERRRRRG